MGNLMASFNTGVSGLQSAQSSLFTTSHNLANTNTKGYSRQQVLVTDFSYQNTYGSKNRYMQVGLGTYISEVRQVRNTFLDGQYRLQFGRQCFYEKQQETLDEVVDLFGEMESEEYRTAISDFWVTLQEASKDPSNIVARDQLISLAETLVDKTVVIKSQLDDYQVSLNTEIVKETKRINEITASIVELNKKIQRYESSGDTAKDFRDSRNLLLDELASYIKYEVIEGKDGTISVYAEADYLVTPEFNNELTVEKIAEDTNMYKVIWTKSGDEFFLSDDLTYSAAANTDVGMLRSLMIARGNKIAGYLDIPTRPKVEDYTDAAGTVDSAAYQQAMYGFNKATEEYNKNIEPSVVMKTQAQLELLIHDLTTTINDVLCPNIEVKLSDGTTMTILDEAKAPIGDDEDKSIGVEIFARRSVPRYEKVIVTLEGQTEPTEVYKYNEEDPADQYSLYCIDQLVVNPLLKKDSSKIPLNANPNTGYVDAHDQIIAQNLIKAWDDSAIALDPNDLTTYKFPDFYVAMVTEMATQGSVWNGVISNQTGLAQDIDDNRQVAMGVSTDEELANLVKYQHCYNASSRYITVIDEMLEHIIERLG